LSAWATRLRSGRACEAKFNRWIADTRRNGEPSATQRLERAGNAALIGCVNCLLLDSLQFGSLPPLHE
jgi:hypothetical protein